MLLKTLLGFSLFLSILLVIIGVSVSGSDVVTASLPSFAQDVCVYFGGFSFILSCIGIAGVSTHLASLRDKHFNPLLCIVRELYLSSLPDLLKALTLIFTIIPFLCVSSSCSPSSPRRCYFSEEQRLLQ